MSPGSHQPHQLSRGLYVPISLQWLSDPPRYRTSHHHILVSQFCSEMVRRALFPKMLVKVVICQACTMSQGQGWAPFSLLNPDKNPREQALTTFIIYLWENLGSERFSGVP